MEGGSLLVRSQLSLTHSLTHSLITHHLLRRPGRVLASQALGCWLDRCGNTQAGLQGKCGRDGGDPRPAGLPLSRLSLLAQLCLLSVAVVTAVGTQRCGGHDRRQQERGARFPLRGSRAGPGRWGEEKIPRAGVWAWQGPHWGQDFRPGLLHKSFQLSFRDMLSGVFYTKLYIWGFHSNNDLKVPFWNTRTSLKRQPPCTLRICVWLAFFLINYFWLHWVFVASTVCSK